MATLGMDPNISAGISQLGGAMMKLPSIKSGLAVQAQKQANADRTYQLGLDRNNAQVPLYNAQADYYRARAAAEQNKSVAASLFPGALEGLMDYTPAVEAQPATEEIPGISPGFQGQLPSWSDAEQPMQSLAAYPGTPTIPAKPAIEAAPARTSFNNNPAMLARAISFAAQAGYNPEQISGALREFIGTGMALQPGQQGEGMNLLSPGSFKTNVAVNEEDRNGMILNNAYNAEELARVKGQLANEGALERTNATVAGAMARQVAKGGTAKGSIPKISLYEYEQSNLITNKLFSKFIEDSFKEYGTAEKDKVKITNQYIDSEQGIEVATELKRIFREKYAETKNAVEAQKAAEEYLKSLKNHRIGTDKFTFEPDKNIIANRDASAPVVSPTGSTGAPGAVSTPASAVAPAAATSSANGPTSTQATEETNVSVTAYARALKITPAEFVKRVKESGMTPSEYYKSQLVPAPKSTSANVTNTSSNNGVNPVTAETGGYVQLGGPTQTTDNYASPVETSTPQEGSIGSLLSKDSQVQETSPADAIAQKKTTENLEPIVSGTPANKNNFKFTENKPVSTQSDVGYNADEAASSIFAQPENKPKGLESLVTNNPFKGTGTVEETLPQAAGSPSGSNAPSTEKTPFEKLYTSLIEEKRRLSKSLMKDSSYGSTGGLESGIIQNKDGTMYETMTRKTIGSQDAVTQRLIAIDKKLKEITNSPFARISPSAAILDHLTIDGAGKYYIEDASKIPDPTKRGLFIDKKELMFLLQNPIVVGGPNGPEAVYKTSDGKYLSEGVVFRDFDKHHEKLSNYFIQEGMFDMKPGDSLARKLFQLKVSADKEILQYNRAKGEKSWLKQQGNMLGLPGPNWLIGNGATRGTMRGGTTEYLKQHPIPDVP